MANVTTSIRLRPMRASDAGWVFEACQDTEIQRWTTIPRPYERLHAEGFVADLAGDIAGWAIVDDASGEPFGVISIHDVDRATGDADIGYWVAPWGRGRGVAAKAVAALADVVRAATLASPLFPIDGLVAKIAGTNIASRRVVEAAGFELAEHDGGDVCPDGVDEVPALRYRLPIAQRRP